MILTIILVCLPLLIFSSVPVVFSLGILSVGITVAFIGTNPLFLFATNAFGQVTHFTLVCVPLFILMAEIMLCSEISNDFFKIATMWVGRLPGGLAVSSEIGCTMFAATMGTSSANTAIMGLVAVPEMIERGYDNRLAAGCVAAGGALGILMPPSVLLIFYGVLVQESIGKLFIAGVLPALLLTGIFVAYIIIRCSLNPSLAPKSPSVPWGEKWSSLWKIWPVICLMIFLFGGIYTGVCTPTEVAAIGVLVATIISIVYKKFNLLTIRSAILRTVRVTCMIMWILVAAMAFGQIITFLGIPQQLSTWALSLSLSRWFILIGIQIILLIVGCFLDPGAIIMIFTPIFAPVVNALGFDLIWFGILFTINMEMGFITPPVGMNLFVMKSIVPDSVSFSDIVHGVLPFFWLEALGLSLLMIFPQIALWLPSTMKF